MVLLGVVSGILIMLIAYALSMLAYFKLRQIKSDSKFSVEIIILAFAVFVSISIKFVIIFQSGGLEGVASTDFWKSMENTFAAIYSGIGGFGFEGLNDFPEEISAFLKCLYAGSSLYAGLMVLSVLTAKISYEIYSGIRILFGLKRKMRGGNTDFYIFSALTEESLTLANSIYEHHAQKSTRECAIIFTGANIDAFDAKEELHREVMTKGYYYWSYSEKSESDGGVFKHLSLPIGMNFFATKQLTEKQEGRIHFFAMDTNEKLSGLESVNSATVFNEIAILANKLVGESKAIKNGEKVKVYTLNNAAVVNFYILADNDINYEFYKREVEKIVSDAIKEYDAEALYNEIKRKYGIEIDSRNGAKDKVVKFFSSYFQLTIINEAELAGKCLAKERQRVLLSSSSEGVSANLNFVRNSLPNQENNYRVMVLGFGINGQQSMKALYQSTAYIDENGIPSRFVADVYDPQTANSAGLFGFKHPMFICVDKQREIASVTEEEWKKEVRFSEIYTDAEIQDYSKLVEVDVNKNLASVKEKYQNNSERDGYLKKYEEWCKSFNSANPKSYADVEKYLSFPVVCFHKISAFEDLFLKFLDKKTGASSTKEYYKAFIIALGDDERNILMANALISDILCERATSGRTLEATIYVNIRDKKNYERINWNSFSKTFAQEINVVVYGASEDMFSYDMIIDDSEAMKFNYGYSILNGRIYNHLRGYYMGLSEEKIGDLVKLAIPEGGYDGAYRAMREKWLFIDVFKKQSNYAVSSFGVYYKACYELALENKRALSREEVIRLASIEHERWNRFHIANGWFFDSKRSDEIKIHNNICSVNMLTVSNRLYDLINVVAGMSKGNDN